MSLAYEYPYEHSLASNLEVYADQARYSEMRRYRSPSLPSELSSMYTSKSWPKNPRRCCQTLIWLRMSSTWAYMEATCIPEDTTNPYHCKYIFRARMVRRRDPYVFFTEKNLQRTRRGFKNPSVTATQNLLQRKNHEKLDAEVKKGLRRIKEGFNTF